MSPNLLSVIVGDTLIRSFDHNSTHHGGVKNESIDILTKNCFANYDNIACVRGTVLCFLSAVTGILCAGRIVSLHLAGHRNFYHNGVFYLAVIQCMLGTAEWVVGWTVHAALACEYLRAMQLLLLSQYYLTMAFRVLRKSESIGARLSGSALSLLLVYFTSFIIMGYVFANSPWFDCYANYWLFLCGGQFLVVQVIVISAVLILSQVNAVTSQPALKSSQRRGHLFLIFTFEISSLMSVAYHLTLFFLANEDIGCSGVFLHNQVVYTPVRIVNEIFIALLPIWVMLYVFQPITSTYDQQMLITATQTSEGSLLDPAVLPNPTVQNWRRRRMLTYNTYRTLLPDAVPYRRLIRSYRRYRPGKSGKPMNMRRSSSAPSMSRKLPTPPLATIPEETSSTHSSTTSSGSNTPPRVNSFPNTNEIDIETVSNLRDAQLIDIIRSM